MNIFLKELESIKLKLESETNPNETARDYHLYKNLSKYFALHSQGFMLFSRQNSNRYGPTSQEHHHYSSLNSEATFFFVIFLCESLKAMFLSNHTMQLTNIQG